MPEVQSDRDGIPATTLWQAADLDVLTRLALYVDSNSAFTKRIFSGFRSVWVSWLSWRTETGNHMVMCVCVCVCCVCACVCDHPCFRVHVSFRVQSFPQFHSIEIVLKQR